MPLRPRLYENPRPTELAVQMGGPVGARDPAVAAHVAVALGLAEPVMPRQAIRVRPVNSRRNALGAFCGVLAKIARDVTLLAQQEVGEVQEGGDPGRGGSSAMAHKRNPVGAVIRLVPAPSARRASSPPLLAAMGPGARAGRRGVAEAGRTLCELLALTGSAAAWSRELLENLTVNAERMRANLDAAASAGDPIPAGADALIDRALEAIGR